MPALAAAYATGATGYGLRAAADEIVMMLPVLRSFMYGNLTATFLTIKSARTADRACVSLPCSVQRMDSISLNLVTSPVGGRDAAHRLQSVRLTQGAAGSRVRRHGDARRAASHTASHGWLRSACRIAAGRRHLLRFLELR